jgi:hypothetical protein
METFISNPEIQSRNSLKSEHLKEGIKPIIACLGSLHRFIKGRVFYNDFGSPDEHNVSYWMKASDMDRAGLKNAGENSYVISPVDDFNKYSMGFRNCTGLVAVGEDKETGKNISFLSHQNPKFFLTSSNKDIFIKDLNNQLQELKEKSLEGTVDVAIVGGNYVKGREGSEKNYLASIGLLSAEVSSALGFEPVVITGPKITSHNDQVFLNNAERKLYIVRPRVGKGYPKSFLPSDIENRKEDWQWDNKRKK